MMSIRREQFNENVFRSLDAASRDLERSETMAYLRDVVSIYADTLDSYSSSYSMEVTMSGMKSLVGGELNSYTEMLTEARQIATKRMVDEATEMGADAVINIRYESASLMQGAAEVMVYGTAVKFI